MKHLFLALLIVTAFSCTAQKVIKKKVEIVPALIDINEDLKPKDLGSLTGSCNAPIEIISCCFQGKIITSRNLPFKIYDVPTANLNLPQDFYNRIISHVPGVQIRNTDSGLNKTPTITMRGDRHTIYVIDGIRYYDASILNAINLNDIESIKVGTDVAASNYLLFSNN
ncbi:TonB-dependent receptor [Cellulophaga sp. Hel_I_12]|uniref:TonB-dependent receptor n=1 Tax=Cellulophaga sp. Hel_I_12 TaxID=1249972 RepID=UPI000645AF90|nr:TonB-dependent receptor plug domain-containing protein [Cellulophaga sp. Hel_I_12]